MSRVQDVCSYTGTACSATEHGYRQIWFSMIWEKNKNLVYILLDLFKVKKLRKENE